ncbi:hypothetical protein JVU11DRAFT_10310 [Chiua virens]|nr:hypothetical protein JVU11DRAFT_10310 [Chiua virens]
MPHRNSISMALSLQLQEAFFGLGLECEPQVLRPQAFPPAEIRPTWNDALHSSYIGYMAAPLPSFTSEDFTQRASAVVANHPSTYTPPHEPECGKIRLILPYPSIRAFPHGQAAAVSPSHPEHVTQWQRMCWEAVVVNGPREFVPQRIYQPGYEGDRKRYVSHAKLHPPIIFLAEYSPEWGIPVSDLLSRGSTRTRVAGGNDPAFTSCGSSICIRVHWPGYRPCRKKLPTKDYTSKRDMIKKERLAKVVARYIKEFTDTMSTMMQVGSDSRWKVGPFGIRVDDIILVSLHHVSQGSWQPQLRLRREIGTNTIAGQYVHGGGEAGEIRG